MLIRSVKPDDYAAICDIYSYYVLNGTGSFEEISPSLTEMTGRIETLLDNGFPFLVAQHDQAVVGYAYAGPHKARSAYRFTVEDSIYVSPEAAGTGLGKRLLKQLIVEAKMLGFKQMMAVIGDSENAGSVGLHRSVGFREIGIAKQLGYKFDRWLDIVYMQYSLE